MVKRGLPTLEEVLEEAGLLPLMTERAMERGLERGKREAEQNIINLLKSGKSAEEIIQLMENGIGGMST